MNFKIISLVFLLVLLNTDNILAQDPKRFEESIRQFEVEDEKDWPDSGLILFTGSSSIGMWQDIGKYFPNVTIINRGFGGSEFSDLLYYSDRIVYPYKPSKIFIYEGDNDLAAGESPEQILEEAKQLRDEIRRELPETSVVFITPKPNLSRWDLKEKYVAFNAALEQYAGETDLTEYADVWTPMLTAEGVPEPSHFLEDGLHMKPSGYELWQKVLQPFLED